MPAVDAALFMAINGKTSEPAETRREHKAQSRPKT